MLIMKKKVPSSLTQNAGMILVAALLAVTCFTMQGGFQTEVSSAGTTVYVPDDHTTIQEAIDATNAGDTIIVKDGTYTENLTVDKKLTIQSENGADSTYVQPADSEKDIFDVTANSISITGFTIELANSSDAAGIRLNGTAGMGINDCTITNNIILNNRWGIWASNTSDSVLSDNLYSHNDYGIMLSDSFNNTLARNEIDTSGIGILLAAGSLGNSLEENTLESNTHYGIVLFHSPNNVLLNNSANFNGGGIYLNASADNLLQGNTVSSNSEEGITIEWSTGNTIIENTCSENDAGITLSISSKSNSIYGNVFVDNNQNTSITVNAGSNIWDDGYPSGGNYWSDYSGSDMFSGQDQDQPGSDGIGDVPYLIPSEDNIPGNGGTDNYPLMQYGDDPNISPVASFTYSPKHSMVGQEITFDASESSDMDGEITSYEWNFGDDVTASGSIVKHTYADTGTYVVTLVVTDSEESDDTTTATIIIIGLMEGDVDQNGYVTLKDSTIIKKWLTGTWELDESQLVSADTYDNDEVTLRDSTLIKKWLVNPDTTLWESPADDNMVQPVPKP